ncbi:MAG: N-acetylmuramoyl-L-alanine amidase family protein [Bacteroidota bacterium]
MKTRVQSYKITHFFSSKMKLLCIFCATILLLSFTLSDFPSKQPVQAKSSNNSIRVVCIDAGHGGKDPGCHGASANEKTVCLNIALKLGAKIKENYPDVKVIYTRDKDVFVELSERAAFANRNKADLFICIHANSASPTAFGSETYVLGLHRTESQQKVADRENSAISLEDDKGEKYKDFEMTPDAIIARQIQLAIFLDQSILFATKVQDELKKLGRYDRGVKQAGFLVLWKTTMPSVLIETGFLTNGPEEIFLANSENQDKVAGSMFEAFKKYKTQLEGVNTSKEPVKTEVLTESVEKKEKEPEKSSDAITFMVQVETSEKKISLTSSRFKGLDVFEYQQDGFYKYAVGNFENDFSNANSYKNEMREKGFQHAFVIAFKNGSRMDLNTALKEIKK